MKLKLVDKYGAVILNTTIAKWEDNKEEVCLMIGNREVIDDVAKWAILWTLGRISTSEQRLKDLEQDVHDRD